MGRKRRQLKRRKYERTEPKLSGAEMLVALAGVDETTPELDLHGLDVFMAQHDADAFLHMHSHQGTPVVKVIYGAGTGRLAEAMRPFLREHPMTVLAKESVEGYEAGTVMYVVLTI